MNSNSKIKLNMDSLKTHKEWVRHKVKDGHNIFRILPPFGEASNGYPYRKWQVIWGLVDPATGRMRPLASSLMSEKRDPVVEHMDQLKNRLSDMAAELKASGLEDKTIAKHPKYARLAKFIRDFSPKTTYVYNAADKAGVVGLLELKSTAHKDLKGKMNEYIKDYNQDPTSLNSADDDSGVWFDVVRSGEKFDTEYKVVKCQTKQKDANGRVVFVDDRSPLAEVIVENYDNVAYDLGAIYKMNTYDELSEIFQANLERLYEMCPEADLSKPFDLSEDSAEEEEVKPVAKPTVTKTAVASKPVQAKPVTAKVALKLDDSDDEADETPVAPTAKKTQTVLDDDDFMREADEILNG